MPVCSAFIFETESADKFNFRMLKKGSNWDFDLYKFTIFFCEEKQKFQRISLIFIKF